MSDANASTVDFSTFVLSLASSVMLHLGKVPDPTGATTQPNLALARQSIDMLAMLQDKTRGNLTAEEQEHIDSVLKSLDEHLAICPVVAEESVVQHLVGRLVVGVAQVLVHDTTVPVLALGGAGPHEVRLARAQVERIAHVGIQRSIGRTRLAAVLGACETYWWFLGLAEWL